MSFLKQPERSPDMADNPSQVKQDVKALQIVLKVASRCNLNCSYCYVYNKRDNTWRDRPRFMSEQVISAVINRIRRHCEWSNQRSVTVMFHGGEPCLFGSERMARLSRALSRGLQDLTAVRLAIQTNGTLLDEQWVEVFRDCNVRVGISMDGPPKFHDKYRVDHRGRGSYQRVVRGLDLLRKGGVPFSILSVVQLGESGREIHRHLADLGPADLSYLLPDLTHDDVAAVRRRFGPTPVADFMLPIIDDWLASGASGVRVDILWSIARLVLGGDSQLDLFGNPPLCFVFVEADGSIEGLDVLRSCGQGMARTGLDVFRNDFIDIASESEMHRATIFEGVPLPDGCSACPEARTCAGGYLPHRYSSTRGFNNPSVWCADILAMFDHVRRRFAVPVEETFMRRQVLDGLLAESDYTQPARRRYGD